MSVNKTDSQSIPMHNKAALCFPLNDLWKRKDFVECFNDFARIICFYTPLRAVVNQTPAPSKHVNTMIVSKLLRVKRHSSRPVFATPKDLKYGESSRNGVRIMSADG